MDKIYLTQKEFDALPEYSISIPTGTTPGKLWKRHIFTFLIDGAIYSGGHIPSGHKPIQDDWWLGEYQQPVNGQIEIKWRLIVIKNNEIPSRVNALGL